MSASRRPSFYRSVLVAVSSVSLIAAQCPQQAGSDGVSGTSASPSVSLAQQLTASGVVVDPQTVTLNGRWSSKWSQTGSDHFARGYADITDALGDGAALSIQQLDDGGAGQWFIEATWTGQRYEGSWSGMQVNPDFTTTRLSGQWTGELQENGRLLVGSWENGEWSFEKSQLPAAGTLDGTWSSSWGQMTAGDLLAQTLTPGEAQITWDGTTLTARQTDSGGPKWELTATWNGDYFVGTWRGVDGTPGSGHWAGEVTESGNRIHGRWEFGNPDQGAVDVTFGEGPWAFDRTVPPTLVADRLYVPSGADPNGTVVAFFPGADGSRVYYMAPDGNPTHVNVVIVELPDGTQSVVFLDAVMWPVEMIMPGQTIHLEYNTDHSHVSFAVADGAGSTTYEADVQRGALGGLLDGFEQLAGRTFAGARQFIQEHPSYAIPTTTADVAAARKLRAANEDALRGTGWTIAGIGWSTVSAVLTIGAFVPASSMVGVVLLSGALVAGLVAIGVGLAFVLFDLLNPPAPTIYWCACLHTYFRKREDCFNRCFVRLDCFTFCAPRQVNADFVKSFESSGLLQ